MSAFSHLDEKNKIQMVDVTGKESTSRRAVASGAISLGAAYEPAKTQMLEKGDLLATATIAGIQGAKQTASLIPLCHPLPLSSVRIETSFDDVKRQLNIRAIVKTTGPTGVEMEALSAVSIALLTVFDMCKAITHEMTIHSIRVVEKTGGKSGDWKNPEVDHG